MSAKSEIRNPKSEMNRSLAPVAALRESGAQRPERSTFNVQRSTFRHRSAALSRDAATGRFRGGFSLLEMMVAVTLILLIIGALLAVFYQTQRAMRLSATQVDLLESGRAGMELLTSELPEISPCYAPAQVNLYAKAFNFLVQPRPAPAKARVNVVQDFFFLRQHNDEWIGTGYFVSPAYPGDPIGTLYRYERSTNNVTDPLAFHWLLTNFLAAVEQNPPPPEAHRVMDRVVNLTFSPYDLQGRFMTNFVDASYSFTNSFTNNVVPGYLDLELVVFEPRAFERYKALAEIRALVPGDPRAYSYLTGHVEKVHLFRQRVPIRTAQGIP